MLYPFGGFVFTLSFYCYVNLLYITYFATIKTNKTQTTYVLCIKFKKFKSLILCTLLRQSVGLGKS